MINKIFLSLVSVGLAVVAYATTGKQSVLELAGKLERKGSQKGRIVFVNKQTKMAETDINAAISYLVKETGYNIAIGAPEGAQAVIEIIADKDAPILVAYPEEHRATVNVTKVGDGLKGEAVAKFYASRCRKELLRAFAYACGGGGTTYKGNIMSIDKVGDLDLVKEFLPYDSLSSCMDRMKALGVTQKEMVSYRRACREGWAPQPTNNAQKVIWEKVHEIPAKPLKIEFDPATQKGKVTK